MAAFMCLPVNPLLNIIPIECHAVVSTREIKHWLNLIRFGQLRLGVIAFHFAQYGSRISLADQGVFGVAGEPGAFVEPS